MRIVTLTAAVCFVQCVPNEPSRGHAPPVASAPRVKPASRRPAIPPVAERRGVIRTLQEPFTDTFDRLELGEDWLAMSPAWRIVQGRLCTGGARNRPVWLKKHMPANARIVFDATPASPDGEIKAEFWGDGESVALGLPYDYATSYVTIFGGWKNQLHVLARLDEHGLDRQELTIDPTSPDPRLMRAAPGNTYRFKVERTDGETVRWYIDDLEMLSYADEWSLSGPRHDHFAFNDSGTRVCFDNLTVTPL